MNNYKYIIKKYGINVGRQYIVDIPNIGRDDLAKLFSELEFKTGAEIGVERGYYSKVLCESNPNLHLSSIDPWLASAYDLEAGIHAVDTEQKRYDKRYEACVKFLKPYNCTVIRKSSLDAVRDFEDESLDFVYIDANHDFLNFIQDLHHWRKRVRVGGIVSGHDYANFPFRKHNHVKRALQVYARCYRMIPLFIVGAMEYEDGMIRDKFRSWFWVKDKHI